MNGWDTEKIIALLQECGDIAIKYYDRPPFELKDDCSVVTVADRKIEQLLAQHFDHPENNSYLIGEETIAAYGEDYIQSALNGNTWVVDPIDGTAPYSIHCPLWGISVAYMEKCKIKEGAVFYPALGEMIFTDGADTWLWTTGGKRLPFPFAAAPLNNSWPVSLSQQMVMHGQFNFSNHLSAWDSAVAVFAYLLRGRVLGYIADLKLWDIAACLAFAERGNFVSSTYQGQPVNCDVADSFYLDSTDLQRWRLRNTTVFAPNPQTLEYILKNTNEGR